MRRWKAHVGRRPAHERHAGWRLSEVGGEAGWSGWLLLQLRLLGELRLLSELLRLELLSGLSLSEELLLNLCGLKLCRLNLMGQSGWRLKLLRHLQRSSELRRRSGEETGASSGGHLWLLRGRDSAEETGSEQTASSAGGSGSGRFTLEQGFVGGGSDDSGGRWKTESGAGSVVFVVAVVESFAEESADGGWLGRLGLLLLLLRREQSGSELLDVFQELRASHGRCLLWGLQLDNVVLILAGGMSGRSRGGRSRVDGGLALHLSLDEAGVGLESLSLGKLENRLEFLDSEESVLEPEIEDADGAGLVWGRGGRQDSISGGG